MQLLCEKSSSIVWERISATRYSVLVVQVDWAKRARLETCLRTGEKAGPVFGRKYLRRHNS